jgi:hypothetical protein
MNKMRRRGRRERDGERRGDQFFVILFPEEKFEKLPNEQRPRNALAPIGWSTKVNFFCGD